MSDRVLDKYTKLVTFPSAGSNAHAALDPAEDDAQDLGAFGWLRGVRERALMLELRKKDGRVLALGYSWIERMEFDPSQGITLRLPGRAIHIKGSGLNSDSVSPAGLFGGLVRHRVPWVRETSRHEPLHMQPNTAIVESIEWEV